jgi:hypothetical protein
VLKSQGCGGGIHHIENLWEICIQNVVAKQHDDTQKAKPDPIHHQSHGDNTFLTMQPTITYCTHTTHPSSHNLNQDTCTIDPPSGQILLGGISWDSDGLLLTPRDKGSAEMEDVQHVDMLLVPQAHQLPVRLGMFRALRALKTLMTLTASRMMRKSL